MNTVTYLEVGQVNQAWIEMKMIVICTEWRLITKIENVIKSF